MSDWLDKLDRLAAGRNANEGVFRVVAAMLVYIVVAGTIFWYLDFTG